MSFSSASDVSAMCQHLLSGSDMFSTATCPTLSEVTEWLSSGCEIIEARIAGKGYSITSLSSTPIGKWLRDINAYYGVWHVELSRSNAILQPGQRTRFQVFQKMFWDGLNEIISMDLTTMGVSRSSTGAIYVGGISYADKETFEADTDRVPPRFRRGQFSFPDNIKPDSYITAS